MANVFAKLNFPIPNTAPTGWDAYAAKDNPLTLFPRWYSAISINIIGF